MLVADACTVDFSPEKLNVALKLKSPLQAYVTMTGVPRYNEFESLLYLDNLDVDLKATNLIYRITAPLLNKFLESGFKDKLPIAVDKMVSLQLEEKLPLSMQLNGMHLKADIKQMQVTELLFQNGGVTAIVKLDDFLIEGIMY
ncbi:MAG: DUF4403 family protein [Saprospiraceae bacterium]|nr:DUF4403 family protein [Saprospiraceae bacterium]